jgi:hypothetical protein
MATWLSIPADDASGDIVSSAGAKEQRAQGGDHGGEKRHQARIGANEETEISLTHRGLLS